MSPYDPATVPFRTRSVTMLQRMGYYDDRSRFNTLTEVEVLSWWNAGAVTVADIRNTGTEAISRYHAEPALLVRTIHRNQPDALLSQVN